MRTGGVDPSRMGRKKRSPKPRQKHSPKSATQQKTQAASTEVIVDKKGEESKDRTAEGVTYVQAPRERLATTPATPGDDGVIDISQQFQVGSQ